MPILLEESLDQLRGRFMRCRAGKALHTLAHDTGVGAATMQKFLNGDNVALESLRALERWCQREETADGIRANA